MLTKTAPINVKALKKSASVLRALNHPIRQSIIRLIHSNQPIQEQDIYKKLKISQSLASYLLTILKEEHFVKWEKRGKQVFYSLNYDRFAKVDRLTKAFLK